MRALVVLVALFGLAAAIVPLEAEARGSLGGHYVGGSGSSHRGGHYVNPRTGNHYTHHN